MCISGLADVRRVIALERGPAGLLASMIYGDPKIGRSSVCGWRNCVFHKESRDCDICTFTTPATAFEGNGRCA